MNDLIRQSVFVPVETFIKNVNGYDVVESLVFLCPKCGALLSTQYYPDLQEVEIEKCQRPHDRYKEVK